MKFQRIEDMRVDHDITIKEISAYLDCNRDVYSRYEKGYRQIKTSMVIELAKFYNCSTDYLLGISNVKRKLGE
ncbi:MAG: helix-turn-helix transcriptional regulator [Fusicatenibacter sp.]|nr:helix-turn-helix transcriptional regulator [Lachnospiraceae bacterium]MDY2937198.1 helix-turn-helix transcriptional regulator [Fusicatenibacter sp.]